MKRLKLIATACVTAVVSLAAANVSAQDWNTNERTYLTFSNSVELPGVTLQPGTYLFRLADSQSNRHIIQVLSQDEKQIHGTILAVPAERLEVTGENVVTFRETAEGQTPAVRFWYYPGDRIGHEFVYPKEQAIQIAARTKENVLSTDGEVTSAEAMVSSMGPDGQTSEWKHEGTAAPTQTAQAQGTAGVSTTESQTTAAAGATATTGTTEQSATGTTGTTGEAMTGTAGTSGTAGTTEMTGTAAMTTDERPQTSGTAVADDARMQDQTAGTTGRADELPRTASPLALSGLLGLLSLAGAFGIRKFRA